MRVRRSRLRAGCRGGTLVVVTVGLLVPFLLARRFRPPLARRIMRLWYRSCCALFGLRVRRHGRPSKIRPTLLVANHMSILDAFVIGAAVDVVFVAKRGVASWPLFGFLSRIGGTVFVDRVAMHSAQECERLRARLRAGQSVLLFAEGTVSDGTEVLPFKSSLLAAVNRCAPRPIALQPVSLAYARARSGAPFTPAQRRHYAWCDHERLVAHFWDVLGRPGAQVALQFHAPVSPQSFDSRKQLAEYARSRVVAGVQTALCQPWPSEVLIDDHERADRPTPAG